MAEYSYLGAVELIIYQILMHLGSHDGSTLTGVRHIKAFSLDLFSSTPTQDIVP